MEICFKTTYNPNETCESFSLFMYGFVHEQNKICGCKKPKQGCTKSLSNDNNAISNNSLVFVNDDKILLWISFYKVHNEIS